MLKILEQHPQVQAIRAFTDVLPEGLGERKFTKLNIIEVERENRSLSMLILSSSTINNWNSIYYCLLMNLVNDNGTWASKTLKIIENQGVIVIKAKHGSKGIHHRSEILLNKLI